MKKHGSKFLMWSSWGDKSSNVATFFTAFPGVSLGITEETYNIDPTVALYEKKFPFRTVCFVIRRFWLPVYFSASGHEGARDIELANELDGLPFTLATISQSKNNKFLRRHYGWIMSPELSSYEDRTLYSTWQLSMFIWPRQTTEASSALGMNSLRPHGRPRVAHSGAGALIWTMLREVINFVFVLRWRLPKK